MIRSAWVLGVFFAAVAEAAEPPIVGMTPSPTAAVTRKSPDGSFVSVPQNGTLAAGELLLLLPGAEVLNPGGSVAIKSLADLQGQSPLPVFETAVTLNEPKNVDLDVTLNRGRIDLTNRKAKGSTVAVVRFHNQKWLLVLETPGTRVALEVSGRWLPGTPFMKPAPKGYEPVQSAILLVLIGSVEADNGQTTLALTAPPGPAMKSWSSLGGVAPGAIRLDALPDWASPGPLTATQVSFQAAVEAYRRSRATLPETAVDGMLDSNRPLDQRMGLVAAASMDDLPRLGKAISTAKDPAIWDFGITVVRHWLGRGPGQEQKLHAYLVDSGIYSVPQAATIIRLLFGFSPDELARPETYEVLIEYLRHDKPGIRNIAAWHLIRIVPAAKGIQFRPNAGKDEFEAVYKRMKELVPVGKLPAPG